MATYYKGDPAVMGALERLRCNSWRQPETKGAPLSSELCRQDAMAVEAELVMLQVKLDAVTALLRSETEKRESLRTRVKELEDFGTLQEKAVAALSKIDNDAKYIHAHVEASSELFHCARLHQLATKDDNALGSVAAIRIHALRIIEAIKGAK